MQITGKTQRRLSPITGKMTLYTQTLQNYVYNHQTAPDVVAVAEQITSEFIAQGQDAYCDGVTLVQGVLTDTIQPSVWIASSETLIIDPVTWAAIASIVKYVALLVLGILAFVAVTAILERIKPEEYYIPESGIEEPVSWEVYISYQNAHYWYVCSKDGAGFGDKSLYPNIEDVPEAIVQAYKDHCASAPDIGPGDEVPNWLMVGGGMLILIAGIWLVGKLFAKR